MRDVEIYNLKGTSRGILSEKNRVFVQFKEELKDGVILWLPSFDSLNEGYVGLNKINAQNHPDLKNISVDFDEIKNITKMISLLRLHE